VTASALLLAFWGVSLSEDKTGRIEYTGLFGKYTEYTCHRRKIKNKCDGRLDLFIENVNSTTVGKQIDMTR